MLIIYIYIIYSLGMQCNIICNWDEIYNNDNSNSKIIIFLHIIIIY